MANVGIQRSEARRRGPSTIRAFSYEMQLATTARTALREEAALALESGHIQPWYQPQISTNTGRVSGFEALARWVHPERGVIPPAEFLPALEEGGLLEMMTAEAKLLGLCGPALGSSQSWANHYISSALRLSPLLR